LGAGGELPGAVLFACNHNAVRSPMAEAILKHLAGSRIYVDSAGVRAGELDPFAAAVMEEIGIDLTQHAPKSLDALNDRSFDLIVSLSPEAHHRALDLAQGFAVDVEYWPTPDPSLTDGSREQILESYRHLRDTLFRKIKQRFKLAGGPSV
jgi:protein-tyrosine-phosphatase